MDKFIVHWSVLWNVSADLWWSKIVETRRHSTGTISPGHSLSMFNVQMPDHADFSFQWQLNLSFLCDSDPEILIILVMNKICLILFLILILNCNGEVFSSVDDMKSVFMLERNIVVELINLAEKFKSKLQKIQRYKCLPHSQLCMHHFITFYLSLLPCYLTWKLIQWLSIN